MFQECSKESQDVNVVRGMGEKKEYRWNAYEEEREGGGPGRGELLQHNNISDDKYWNVCSACVVTLDDIEMYEFIY